MVSSCKRGFVSAVVSIFLFPMVFPVLFQGCATYNKSEVPNLSLRGEAAQKEYEKFKMESYYWSGQGVTLGKSGPVYSRESLRSVMSEVSPSAVESMNHAETLWNIGTVTLGAAIATLIGYFATSSGSAHTALLISTLTMDGATMGCSIGRDIYWDDSTDEFNRDLRSKLGIKETAVVSPGFNVAFHF